LSLMQGDDPAPSSINKSFCVSGKEHSVA
jgi:hypothetical protein